MSEHVRAVTWLLIRDGYVAMEWCTKKARVFEHEGFFVPGGKVEYGETPEAACRREIREEWPGVDVLTLAPLPIIEGAPVRARTRDVYLLAPFVVTVRGDVPNVSGDGMLLHWLPVAEALASPVPQVRMMIAAALDVHASARLAELARENAALREALTAYGKHWGDCENDVLTQGDPCSCGLADVWHDLDAALAPRADGAEHSPSTSPA